MDVKSPETLRGNLYKWTNYIKGYQKRWFVLQNGFVSYYRNQAEMAHTCRGTINLVDTKINTTGSTTFTISNSSNQTFHLRAMNEADQKKWVSSLLSAKAKAIQLRRNGDDSDTYLDSDEFDEFKHNNISPDEAVQLVNQTFSKLEAHLSDLQHHHETLTRKNGELQRALKSLESARNSAELLEQFEDACERMVMYKVVSLAMVSSCADFITLGRGQVQRWRRVVTSQHDRCALLEQMIEELAKQLRQLEMLVKQKNPQATQTLAGSNAASTTGPIIISNSHESALSTFPGQAIRIGEQRKNQRSELSAKPSPRDVEVKNDVASAHAIRKTPTPVDTTIAPPVGAPTSVTEDSSEDDFYDAEEVISEYSIYLPSGAATERDEQQTRLNQKDEDTSSTYLCPRDEDDLNFPTGTDVAFEYESDIEYAEEDAYHDSASYGAKGLREAQVVQTKQKRVVAAPQLERKEELDENSSIAFVPRRKMSFERRTSIPFKPNYSLNLWSIMKNCIGKELTKIPMPVNFSEPLSMLQRLTEDFEYSSCLDKAAHCTNSLEQMVHVAAFTVSSYASTAVRVNKPFNPLLGETYECDRTDDLGWRSLAEQVSHHPPKCALHCESNLWYCWFEFSMNTKFRGKYLQINPIGTCHLVFRRTGHHYTWQKIPMTVHNIIVGRLWIDNSGEMDIVNHHTGEKCHLSYKAYSYFSNDTPRRVSGAVTDKPGSVRYVLNGTWDEFMEYSPVLNVRTARGGKPLIETGNSRVIWRRNTFPPDADRMYFFTTLALQLNQEEEGVCPTDCRFRPDQRLMELGRWDEANREKVVLEEKQRARRRQAAARLAADSLEQSNKEEQTSSNSDSNATVSEKRNSLSPTVISSFLDVVDNSHKPLWFDRQIDSDTGTPIFVFNKKYWDCKERGDWSMCPKLY